MRERIAALRQERTDLHNEADAMYTAARGENRGLTPEERERDDAISTRIAEIDDELVRLERHADREARMQADRERRVNADVAAAIDGARAPAGGQRAVVIENAGERYGYANLADFARDVQVACRPGAGAPQRLAQAMEAMHSPGAAPTNFHRETGADEGYEVPPAFRQSIWDLVYSGNDILNMVEVEPTDSNFVQLLKDEDTPWGATGVQAKWRGEGTQMTATKVSTKLDQVPLHELYAFVLATEELLRDAPRLNARLTRKAAAAILYKASDALPNGTGAGQPMGWMNSAAKVAIADRDNNNQISTGDIADMEARFFEIEEIQGGGRAVYFAHRSIIPQLVGLTIGNQPVWTPPVAGMQQRMGGFLMGRPIKFTQHCQVLGTSGDLQLVDLSGYYATQRDDGIQAASSIHLFFDYGIQAFRWTFRFGGQPFLSAPVSPDNGSDTMSHFVVLPA